MTPTISTYFRRFSMTGLALLAAIASTVLIGWLFRIQALQGVWPGAGAVNPLTAAGLALCAISAGAAQWGGERRPWTRWLAIGVGCGVAGIGIASIGAHTGWFAHPAALLGARLPRPLASVAPTTASCLALVGAALIFSHGARPFWTGITHGLCLSTATIGAIALVGHAFGERSLCGGMAPATAVGTLIISALIPARRPGQGFIRILGGEGAGGRMARLLLPASILLPTGVGLLALAAEKRGLCDTSVTLAMTVASSAVLGAALVGIMAFRLETADAERRAAADDLARTNADLEARVQARTAELVAAHQEQLLLQEQLRQSQKLEALGQLAGGIAHDFNNMLSVINGYAEMLEERIHPEAVELHQPARYIAEAGERATRLTRQLLAFSRKQELRPQALGLNCVLRDIRSLLRRLIGEDVQVSLNLHPEELAVWMDVGQLEQIVMNLAVNARDAMPEGGAFTVETCEMNVDEAFARLHPDLSPGRYACLRVSDSGCGMDSDTMEHVFEPFFTTKPEGKGTGLGLATVYGIVSQHLGHISAESEPGSGTTFTIYLPLTDETPQAKEKEPAGRMGAGTVLVVEDEEQLLHMTTLVLRHAGYSVLAASTPGEALRKAENTQVDLLLTDVVMPEMSGRDLAHRLSTSLPALPVLYMSGYTGDAIERYGVDASLVDVLTKPFSTSRLETAVSEALETASAC